MIVCRTLGPLEIDLDGSPAPPEFLWRKNVGLFLYLVRSPTRSRTRNHLVGILWPDKPDAAAKHSLRESIRVLKHHLGPDMLEADADTVRLVGDGVALDTDDFERRRRDGDLLGAAALVRGEYLEGFSVPDASAFEDWLGAERLAWLRRSVEALVEAAEASLRAGDIRTAGDLATRALGLEPASDRAVKLAMRSLYRLGQRAAAMELFQRFARAMTALGAQPEPETVELDRRIREEPRGPEPPTPQRAASIRRAPLVGRAEIHGRLVDAWNACRRERRPTVILVEGDNGWGKSRLAEELRAQAGLDGAVTPRVRSIQADLTIPWCGVIELLRSGFPDAPGLAAIDSNALAAIVAVVPEWADRFRNVKADAGAMPLARAFGAALRAVAVEQPVFMELDDAHWLDAESLLAVHAALRDTADGPLLVWINSSPASRRDEIEEIRSRIGRELAGESITLKPFGREEVEELVARSLPRFGGEQRERLCRRILVDSGGVPLLAVELLHAVESGLDLDRARPDWPQPLRTLDHTLPADLPDAAVGAIRVGFRCLSPEAQNTLRVAAVAGERVEPETAGAGTGLERADLNRALDELEWERWLEAGPRGYSFVARIVREVILRDMVAAGQRRRIEAAIRAAAPPDPPR